ncbi:transposase [Streptomyces sp. NPDC056930]|uniref:transposase n=1 Tax=Streptomyces sp. NPDC056930 TaxID=3345967 RepID=UPI00363828C9
MGIAAAAGLILEVPLYFVYSGPPRVSPPGVARQYSRTLGKVGNCQIGVSVRAASDTASCPLSWRLFLPQIWDSPEAADRRAHCRIPDGERHRPKWRLGGGVAARNWAIAAAVTPCGARRRCAVPERVGRGCSWPETLRGSGRTGDHPSNEGVSKDPSHGAWHRPRHSYRRPAFPPPSPVTASQKSRF